VYSGQVFGLPASFCKGFRASVPFAASNEIMRFPSSRIIHIRRCVATHSPFSSPFFASPPKFPSLTNVSARRRLSPRAAAYVSAQQRSCAADSRSRYAILLPIALCVSQAIVVTLSAHGAKIRHHSMKRGEPRSCSSLDSSAPYLVPD
jgi:hypothetical protein